MYVGSEALIVRLQLAVPRRDAVRELQAVGLSQSHTVQLGRQLVT